MSNASTKTFLNGINSGNIDNMKSKIYYYIKRNPDCTLADIDFSSVGMKNSSITARLSDLLDLGVIKITGEFNSKESVYSTFKTVEDTEEQTKLYNSRYNAKTKRIIKSLIKRSGLPSDFLNSLKTQLQK